MTTNLSISLHALKPEYLMYTPVSIVSYMYWTQNSFHVSIVHEVVRMHVIHVLGVRCPLSTIMYMIHAWSTNRALVETTDDVKIKTKIGIIYQWCCDICSWELINGLQILLGGAGAKCRLMSQCLLIKERWFNKLCIVLSSL